MNASCSSFACGSTWKLRSAKKHCRWLKKMRQHSISNDSYFAHKVNRQHKYANPTTRLMWPFESVCVAHRSNLGSKRRASSSAYAPNGTTLERPEATDFPHLNLADIKIEWRTRPEPNQTSHPALYWWHITLDSTWRCFFFLSVGSGRWKSEQVKRV